MAIVPRPVPVNPSVPPPAPPPRPVRWRRWLAITASVLIAATVVAMLTFPTDTLVRSALTRITPSSGPFLVFERAVLRPWGLRLDAPALRRLDGTAIVDAQWIRFRPSLLGLFRDGTGRPWHVASGACGGTLDADVTVDPSAAAALEATWTDLDLAACPPPLTPGVALTGRVTGRATARAGNGVAPSGEGELTLREASWKQEGSPLPFFDVLHVDTAGMRWSIADERLQLEGLQVRGPELELEGSGTIRLTGSPEKNVLDLKLSVLAGPEASDELVSALEQLPRSTNDPMARSLVIKGTIGAPVVVMPR